MKATLKRFLIGLAVLIMALPAYAAYHHEGEQDADKFLEIYPNKKNSKLDHCALCHAGGSYEKSSGTVTLGSCQWCHYSYGYDGSGNIVDTLNAFGKDYFINGRDVEAITAINSEDSDKDGYTNAQEIEAERFPGDAGDDPSKTDPPYRIYTREQIEAMDQHTQFMLMNTARSGDFYAQYEGVPLKDLLDSSGILSSATGITVFAPDGWSQYHPLNYDADAELYHVYGDYPGQTYQYPPSSYYYVEEAESWCDYSSAYCAGRNHNDPIPVEEGLKAILAVKVDGVCLETGALTDENKLDGDGPFRIVVPQKNPNAPDQSSKSSDQDVTWPYNSDWDHNAGACTRSVTIIRVEPLPEGTTDLDVYEDGWNYVDQGKIIIYGAINGTDSNGNGILDTEECVDKTSDFDNDGIPDYRDVDTAGFTPVTGGANLLLCSSAGQLTGIKSINDTDASLPQTSKPDMTFPYGVTQFQITGLSSGETTTISIIFPDNVPTTAKYYKIDSAGWREISFGSNDGDNIITLTLTDGDSITDSDGIANGSILDPGVLAVSSSKSSSKDDDDKICFVSVCKANRGFFMISFIGIMGILIALSAIRTTKEQ
ncbi:MAG: hypothetical protein KJ737_13705 [Proteobacteria bacterium]|nr:hypothetical protein [Pseudomonadota bacterium]